MKEITVDDLINALDSVVWHNNIGKRIREWLDFKVDPRAGHYILYPLDRYLTRSEAEEVIWMICVCLFGNYGTSLESGWIEDVEGFREFIDKITVTYCGDKGGICYECIGNGDDQYLDEDGNWVSVCPDCPYSDSDCNIPNKEEAGL